MRDLLEGSGLAWEQRYGSRHIKVYLEGRLVQCWSTTANDSPSNRGNMNALAQVKRAVRHALSQRAQLG